MPKNLVVFALNLLFNIWIQSQKLVNKNLRILSLNRLLGSFGANVEMITSIRVELLPGFKFTGKTVKITQFTGKW